MDVFAHGLWSYQLVGKRSRRVLLAVAFGVLPDLFAFTPFFFQQVFSGGLALAHPENVHIPDYVYRLYDVSHSLIVAALTLGAIRLLCGNLPLYLLAWPLHIVMDIPTHSRAFFPTPFLWPISSYKVDGIAWSTPWLMILNYSAIALVFLLPRVLGRRSRGS